MALPHLSLLNTLPTIVHLSCFIFLIVYSQDEKFCAVIYLEFHLNFVLPLAFSYNYMANVIGSIFKMILQMKYLFTCPSLSYHTPILEIDSHLQSLQHTYLRQSQTEQENHGATVMIVWNSLLSLRNLDWVSNSCYNNSVLINRIEHKVSISRHTHQPFSFVLHNVISINCLFCLEN